MSKARLRLQSPTVPHFGHPLNPPKNLPLEDDLNAEFRLDQSDGSDFKREQSHKYCPL